MYESAGIVASSKEVTSEPVVVEVVVVPAVTTAFPALLRSVAWCRIFHVTEGVEEPIKTARISVMVMARLVKTREMSSELVGSSTVIE